MRFLLPSIRLSVILTSVALLFGRALAQGRSAIPPPVSTPASAHSADSITSCAANIAASSLAARSASNFQTSQRRNACGCVWVCEDARLVRSIVHLISLLSAVRVLLLQSSPILRISPLPRDSSLRPELHTYLMSGVSRNLGLETARQLLAASSCNGNLAAACDPASAKGLQDLVKAVSGRMSAATVDVASSESIKVSL